MRGNVGRRKGAASRTNEIASRMEDVALRKKEDQQDTEMVDALIGGEKELGL